MEYRKLEDQIKSIVDHHQPELDHNELWNNIKPKLKKKKRRRFIIFWSLLGGMAIATFSFINSGLLNNRGDIALIDATDLDASKNLFKTEIEKSTLTNESAQSDEIHHAAQSAEEQKFEISINPEVYSSETSLSKNTDVRDQYLRGSKSRENYARKHREDNHELESKSKSTETARLSIEESISRAKESAASIISAKLPLDKLNVWHYSEQIKDGIQASYVGKNDVIVLKEGTSNSNSMKTLSVEKKNGKNESDVKEEIKKEKQLTKSRVEKKPHEIKTKWRPRGRWQLAIQPSVGSAWAINTIKSSNGDPSSTYAKRRRDTERTLEAYAGGVNIRISNEEHRFIALAGVQYRRLNQRFDQSSSEKTTETGQGVVAVVEDAEGRIIESETGQMAITKTIVSKYRTYNHYNYFSVPIGVGTKWSERKYSVAVIAGIDYNLGFKFNGTILDTDGKHISFKDGADDSFYNSVYKKKTGIDFWITAEYARNLDRRTQVTIVPKFQIPTTSIHRDNFNVNQRFYLLGLDVGIVYLLD